MSDPATTSDVSKWAPTAVAILGSGMAVYVGVKVGMARLDEKHVALVERVMKAEAELVRVRRRLHSAEGELRFLKGREDRDRNDGRDSRDETDDYG